MNVFNTPQETLRALKFILLCHQHPKAEAMQTIAEMQFAILLDDLLAEIELVLIAATADNLLGDNRIGLSACVLIESSRLSTSMTSIRIDETSAT